MKRGALAILMATLLLAMLAAAAGCGPATKAVHTDNAAGVAVRLPVVESPKVSLRAHEPVRPGPMTEPASVGDEYRGRWLTLIEVTVTPPEAESPPSQAPAPSQ